MLDATKAHTDVMVNRSRPEAFRKLTTDEQ
jgi:hypothetical protein